MSSALLRHVWGESPAADRVWAQVAGLRPQLADGRLLMVLQAYIDDSQKDGWFVLAGHIATTEAWAAFSRDWENLLPTHGTMVPSPGTGYHFKMSEMAMIDERMSRVPAFYRLIEEHVAVSLSCAYRIVDLERAKQRIYIPNAIIDFHHYNNHYMFAFKMLMDMFHTYREIIERFIPVGDKIDFYFDEQAEKKIIVPMWDDYIRNRPAHVVGRYGATPRFEDDREFLPLQAADLWAWWVRKWTSEGHPELQDGPDFGSWQGKRAGFPKLAFTADEDSITKGLVKIALELMPDGYKAVYDLKMDLSGVARYLKM